MIGTRIRKIQKQALQALEYYADKELGETLHILENLERNLIGAKIQIENELKRGCLKKEVADKLIENHPEINF